MIRMYYHKTDGGAEYLCSNAVSGTDEGMFEGSDFIVRLDGEPELYDKRTIALAEALQAILRATKAFSPTELEILGECGQCGSYHRPGYVGECRDDSERWPTANPLEDSIEQARVALKAAGIEVPGQDSR